MTRQQLLAASVLESRALIARYFKGFDDTNHTTQDQNLPNHFAWTLGHLALNLHRTAERFDGMPLPEEHFTTGTGHQRGERFDTEAVAFDSHPLPDRTLYPSRDRCVAIFDAAVERLAAAVRDADDAKLVSMTPWGKVQVPLWSMAIRMVFHNGTHCGQLADLRRALGLGSIFA